MKYVRYFSKTLMTDKFMLCMILFILIAILTLIIVSVLKSKAGITSPAAAAVVVPANTTSSS